MIKFYCRIEWKFKSERKTKYKISQGFEKVVYILIKGDRVYHVFIFMFY